VQLAALPARASAEPVLESAHSRSFLLAPRAELPNGTDAVIDLADSSRFAYAPRAPDASAPTMAAQLAIDPFVRGNAFRPLHESSRALSALLSIAAGRRVDTGADSERTFLFLRGAGLVFEENGDTHRFEPNHVALVPPGEPARVWAQGPEDALVIVFQPKGVSAPRRTLRREIDRVRRT